jgi:flagella basal body P-ring formation protein FlgA
MTAALKRGFALTTLLLLCAFESGAQTPVKIRLYDLVFVSGGYVLLGDIARLEGDPATVARLRTLQIGSALKRRESRVITADEIRRFLPAEIEVSFFGPPAVEVRPQAYPGEFCGLESTIQRRFTSLGGDSIAVNVRLLSGDGGIDGGSAAPLQYSIASEGILAGGKQIVTVECRKPDGALKRLQIPIEVRLFARLAYAARHIKKGELLQPQDLLIQSVDLSTTGWHGFIFHPQDVIGWEADRHISPRNPLRWDHVRRPAVVRKGDGVLLKIEAREYQIKTAATALESGSPGQQIWVRLEENGKRMRAVVVDGATVTLK